MPYQWVTSLRRYRDTQTGQFVSQETINRYSLAIIDAGDSVMDAPAEMVADGRMSPDAYIDLLHEELKSSAIQQYVLNRGGRSSMTWRDWGQIGAELKKQYALMEGFRARLWQGGVSADYVRARSRLYFSWTRSMAERGKASSHGVPILPAYPADGTSECGSNDGCTWNFVHLDGDGDTDAYWDIDPFLENCDTCLDRHAEWYPLRIRGGALQPYRDIRAGAHDHAHHSHANSLKEGEGV